MSLASYYKLLCPYQVNWLRDLSPLAMGEKSRRIGWTWTQALGVVLDRIEGKGNYYHSSADQTASVEFIAECETWAGMANAVAKVTDGEEIIEDEKITTLVMTFGNGKKIVAGSSNPKFFRSKGGAVGLDEYAFHAKGRDLFKAAHATAMFWGYPLRIWSTHNGPASYFNGLLKQAASGKLKAKVHRVTILDAVDQGIVERIDMRRRGLEEPPAPDEMRRREWLEELRSTCPDEDTWAEEYLCIPSTDAGAFLDYELLRPCESAELEQWELPTAESPWPTDREIYLGVDVGRKNDLTSFCALERVGPIYFTRMVHTMRGAKYSEQEAVLDRVMACPSVVRACIDETGLGNQFAERAADRFGHRVEPVMFTGQMKADLAMPVRRVFEDREIVVPDDDAFRADLHSVRKVVTAAGNVRFEAPRDGDGHGDRFWSLALALHGANAESVMPEPLEELPSNW